MNKEELKRIIIDQNKAPGEDYIKRELLGKLKEQMDHPFIVIISGIRRSGKSTLLQEIRKISKEKSYYLNFDDDRLNEFTIKDFQAAWELFIELYGPEHTFYFDEIQNIDEWETFVRRLFDNGNKVYITGSNASMLSRELGTRLTGRHVRYDIYPFSFREYLDFKKVKLDKNSVYLTEQRAILKRYFNEYLKEGGIPEYLKYGNRDHLKALFDNILYRDVLSRYNLSNEKTLKDLVHYIASNIGKEVSFNSLRKTLQVSNPTTIKEYLNYFENSYLMFTIPMYSESLKKQIYSNKKVYFIDTGLAQNISFRFSEDRGRMLENLVFIHLKRKNREIYFHRGKKECDFLTIEGTEVKEAIQVTKSLDNPKTKERELEGLLEALKAYDLEKGLILTEDTEDEFDVEGKKIIVIPIWKWLLEDAVQ